MPENTPAPTGAESPAQGLNDASSPSLSAPSGGSSPASAPGNGPSQPTEQAPAQGSVFPATSPASVDGQERGGQGNQAGAGQKSAADAPITDWSKVKITLPQGQAVDQQVLDGFGKTAVDLGLTQKQAQALVDFQLRAVNEQRERLLDAGAQALRQAWGGKVAENQQAVLTLIANIDRAMGEGNKFSKALDMCGATCLPEVCQGLLYLAKSLSEDSMGRGGAAGAADRPESAEEALMAEYRKVRGGRP